MDKLDVLATWAGVQSHRELAMLKLGVAYHMLLTGQQTLTLSLTGLTEMLSPHTATVRVEPDNRLTFTLEPRAAAPTMEAAVPER
jgi:hypothetical protein